MKMKEKPKEKAKTWDGPKRKTKKKAGDTERAKVREFVGRLSREYSIYSYIDQDSPARYARSGFDFLLAAGGQVIFVEAKVAETDEKAIAKLSDFQRATLAKVIAAKNSYVLLIFPPTGPGTGKGKRGPARALEALDEKGENWQGHPDAYEVFASSLSNALRGAP